MRASLFSMTVSLLFFGMALGVASGQLDVSVAGLQVVGEGYTPEVADKEMFQELRAFNWKAGTKVALLVKSKGKTIIGMDEEGSTVTVFSDDKGTDFTKVKRRFSNKSVGFGFPRLSEDGKALMAEVETAGIPQKGSQSIILKGELLVSVASESSLSKSVVTEVKKGAKLTVGKQSFEVAKAGKPDWGDDPWSIELKSNVSHKDFKAFKFYDAKGEEIKADQNGSGSMGMFGKRSYTVTFNLAKKVEKIILGLDGWTDLEVVKVPFEVTVNAGL
ncbi:MAG: hypothetical protein ACJAVK_001502 [Akkermansiaceae bacterium]